MAFNWGRTGLGGAQRRRRRRGFAPLRARNYRGGGFGSTGITKRYSSRYRGAMYGRGASYAATRAIRYTNANARNEELKYIDIASTQYACGTTGVVTLINGVAAGNTAITRLGKQCYWKSLSVQGTLAPPDATTVGSRNDVYVIYDKQPGAAVPAMTDIFVQAIAGSPMNLNYRERFLVIAHQTFVLGGPIGAAGASFTPNIHAVSINKKFNLRTTFKGDANAIGDIATGAMYLVTIGSAADADCGALTASIRLRFAER